MEDRPLNIDPKDMENPVALAQVGLTLMEAGFPGPSGQNIDLMKTIAETYSEDELLAAVTAASGVVILTLAESLGVHPLEAVAHVRRKIAEKTGDAPS